MSDFEYHDARGKSPEESCLDAANGCGTLSVGRFGQQSLFNVGGSLTRVSS